MLSLSRSLLSPSSPKVVLLGASGGIGQPLAMLLRMSPRISDLALYDIKQAATPAAGISADVSHIDAGGRVAAYAGEEELREALRGADVVVMTAGVPRKPGMTRNDLFTINGKIVKGLAEGVATHCPEALTLIISNPVNSTVPVAAEAMKAKGGFDWRKLLGVTTLDCVRARTFYAALTGKHPGEVDVPVIGGHAGETIMPLLSQASPDGIRNLTEAQLSSLDQRIQDAGTEVVEAKNGAGSATLSMAYAAAEFTDSVLRGLQGDAVQVCTYLAYTEQNEYPETVGQLDYFARKVILGKEGVESVLPIGSLTSYEVARLSSLSLKLKEDVDVAAKFMAENK